MNRTPSLLGAFAFSLVALAGCGDSVVTRQPGDPEGGIEPASTQPPPPPAEGVAPDGPGLTFALSQINLGYRPRGWESLGLDLDGLDTRKAGLETCRNMDPKGRAKLDGDDGRDNAFGRDILDMARTLNGTVEDDAQRLVASGAFTTLLSLAGVGESAAYVNLSGAGFAGAPLVDEAGARLAPAWDGSDDWPVNAASVDGDLETPRLRFEGAYLTPDGAGGTWVGYGKGPLEVRIPLDQNHIGVPETTFHITIVDPVIVAPLSADRTRIVGGTVAGTLDPDAVAQETIRVAQGVFPPYCQADEAAKLADFVWSLADIHADFRDDPEAECERLSAGFAFDAEVVTIGGVARAEAALDDPCAEW